VTQTKNQHYGCRLCVDVAGPNAWKLYKVVIRWNKVTTY